METAGATGAEPDARRWRRPTMVLASFSAGAAGGVALAAFGFAAGLLDAPSPTPPAAIAALDPVASTAADLERLHLLKGFATTLPADPEARFRLAVSLAGEDLEMAVIAYSHAAVQGHARAAYYLGQVFETGEGVPVDLALARAWYQIAADEVDGAKASLAGLSPPEPGKIAPPVPLLGQKTPDGFAELSWVSSEGSDPAAYTIEFAADGSLETLWSKALSASATRVPLPKDASRWRVIATDAAGESWQPSQWQPLIEP